MTSQTGVPLKIDRSVSRQITKKLAISILSGSYQEGQIIPSEALLCEEYGVSRTAMREAIKSITSKGMLESKTKVGTKVCPRDSWNFLDSQLLTWMSSSKSSPGVYKQFLELRRAIEPQATALCAERASKEQRIELSRLFQQMTNISSDFDQEKWVDVDMDFHRLIYQSTGNCFFLPIGNILSTVMREFFIHSSQSGGMCLKEHRAIYEAIMAGDSERAYQASLSLMINEKHLL